ncbi:MAG: acylase [Rhodothermaceae bacterium]|nr:acylase [Rhodothermaceae bacterium]
MYTVYYPFNPAVRKHLLLVALLVSVFISSCSPTAQLKKHRTDLPEREHLVIHRDTWGVPHIFGKTNADAAFGLAYAHAEDDFTTIQTTLLAARARVGHYLGRDGATVDFFVKFFDFPGQGDAKYDEMSDAFKQVAEGYVNGINYYAETHPKEVQYDIFPVRPEDIITGYIMSIASFIGVPGRVSELFEEERRHRISKNGEGDEEEIKGSNAFAFAPHRTADGSTVLVANTHQPWTGPLAWYEAHVKSEEGWNAAGGLFPGSPVLTIGFNEHLGWTHTVNRPDLIDTFVLTMHPDDPLKYRFDGEWLTLSERTVKLRVKVFGFLRVSVKRTVYDSIYGPTLKTDHGTYAIRYGGFEQAGALDQWFHMALAKNKAEWDAAMATNELPMFNTVYADKAGNISYIYNARIPLRDPSYNWSVYLPGDTSATLWDAYLPYDQLPHVENPSSGFVQNCNATPFTSTDGPGNPDASRYPLSMGIERHMNNRELRAMELFGSDKSLTMDEILAYKYDMKYSDQSAVARSINQLREIDPPTDSLTAAAREVLLAWDRNTNPENTKAALGVLTYHGRLTKRLIRNADSQPSVEDVLASLKASAEFMMTHHGTLEVRWDTINRLQRGSTDLGIGGGPDILHAVYGSLEDDGRARGTAGDSHIWVARWKPDGTLETHSIHPFGSATSRPESPHHTDQSPLFVKRQLKTLWFKEEDVLTHSERSYFPGEE